MRKKILFLTIVLGLAGCHDIPSWDDDLYGNFDALWTIIDEHYCFLDEKGVDWDAIGREYRAAIDPEMGATDFFTLMGGMLDRLEDGHVNLSSTFAISYYRKWWSDYPQNFDWRLIQENYLDFDYTQGNGMSYKVLEGNVGYLYYSSFSYGISETFLDVMFMSFQDCPGLIIDVRNNGGGNISNVESIVSRFLDKKILAGSICHKTGPGHNDFSEPYDFYFEPQTEHVRWLRPVVVLANRSTFSAANNFVSVMKSLPLVTVVGDRTGGGCGIPFSSEIPCGWGVRFSACPVYDAEGNLTEFGVDPTEGCHVDMTPEDVLAGRDPIIDFAVRILAEEEE